MISIYWFTRFYVVVRIILCLTFIVGLFVLLWFAVDEPFEKEDWKFEFVGGLATSLLFFILIYLMRPRIMISPTIANPSEGKYYVKMINASLASIVDVKIEMKAHKIRHTKKGDHVSSGIVPIDIDCINILPGQLTSSGWKYKQFAQWIRINRNLHELWEAGTFDSLSFSVVARHGISGLVGSNKRHYYSAGDDLEEGEFIAGNRMIVKKL